MPSQKLLWICEIPEPILPHLTAYRSFKVKNGKKEENGNHLNWLGEIIVRFVLDKDSETIFYI
jgi:hypothetical protein